MVKGCLWLEHGLMKSCAPPSISIALTDTGKHSSICVRVSVWVISQVREYLEKNYKDTSGKETIKLTIKALTEAVEAGSKSIELTVVEPGGKLRFLEDAEVDALVQEINEEKAAADASRRSARMSS